MSSFTRLRERTNKSGVDFLFSEMDTAHTFLQLAATTGVEETRRRNIQNAQLAYDTILQHQAKVILTSAEKNRLEEGLGELKRALEKLGAAR